MYLRLRKSFKFVMRHRALLTLLAVLLIAEAMVRTPWFWTLDPLSSTGRVDMTTRLAFQEAPEPRVVFMGNSLMRDGVSPLVVSRELGIPSRQVANVGYGAAMTSDYLQFYRDNRGILRQADVLIIGVDPRDFAPWKSSDEVTNRFRRRASISERMEEPSWRIKTDLLVGWFWRTWDARYMLNGYMKNLVRGTDDQGVLVDDLLRIMPGEAGDEPVLERKIISEARKIAQYHHQISEERLDDFIQLLSMAEQDGLRVVLVDPFLHPLVLRKFADDGGAQAAAWRRRVQAATGQTIYHIGFNGSRCARWQECFQDYGHLNMQGAREYSEAVGEWLAGQFLIVTIDKKHAAN